jgi:tRNA (cmo5U34)-methyltransferase
MHDDRPAAANGALREVGNGIASKRAAWSFGGAVPEQFFEHAVQSIPGYEEGHRLVCSLSEFFCGPNSTAYEIGSSTGELIRKLAAANSSKANVRWVGIDNVQAMVDKARLRCADLENVAFVCEDIASFEFEECDFLASYYVIQFVPRRARPMLLRKIYNALRPGGAFVWFEKIRGADARFQDIMSQMYNEFKLEHGFTSEQIMAKTLSLKSVLEPLSSQENAELLAEAGFRAVTPVYRNICFEGLLCIK